MTPVWTLAFGKIVWPFSGATLLALTLLLPVFGWVMWRAQRRLQAASAVLRAGVVALNALAYVALLLLLAPPEWPLVDRERVVLVTEGAESLDDLKQSTATYLLGDSLMYGSTGLLVLTTPAQLRLKHPGLDELALKGHGLDKSQWSTLPIDVPIDWSPPPLAGLVALDWSTVLDPGTPLLVTGELRLAGRTATAEVRLQDPAGVTVDRSVLSDDDVFALRTVPRALGAVTYRLQLLEDGAVTRDEPVTTYVRDVELARLLVMQSAPSFETRQLANWAADRGSRLLIDTGISRDRSLVQRINLPESAPSTIDAPMLAATDLAVVDGRRWVQLDVTLRESLLSAVEDGLGLLLLLDESLAAWLDNHPEMREWLGVRLARVEGEASYRLAGVGGDESEVDEPNAALPAAPWRIDTVDAQTLTRAESGAVLESWRAYGRGRLALSRLRERHRWATSGDRSVFARYWARILQTLGRPGVTPKWRPTPAPTTLRVGQRIMFCANLVDEKPLTFRFAPLNTEALEDAAVIEQPLTPHSEGSAQGCGFVWPDQSGWHSLTLVRENGETTDRVLQWVFGDDVHRADRFARRQSATARRLAASPDEPAKPAPVYEPISPWWGWGLLVLALAPLWLERRLSQLGG